MTLDTNFNRLSPELEQQAKIISLALVFEVSYFLTVIATVPMPNCSNLIHNKIELSTQWYPLVQNSASTIQGILTKFHIER